MGAFLGLSAAECIISPCEELLSRQRCLNTAASNVLILEFSFCQVPYGMSWRICLDTYKKNESLAGFSHYFLFSLFSSTQLVLVVDYAVVMETESPTWLVIRSLLSTSTQLLALSFTVYIGARQWPIPRPYGSHAFTIRRSTFRV